MTDPTPHDLLPSLSNPSGLDLPVRQDLLSHILADVEEQESVRFSLLELVYLPEEEMIRLNRDHKQHEYLTDILTFPYHEEGAPDLEATLFCSPKRIQEQSDEWSSDPTEEFYRVYIHGLLHLAGYDDQDEVDRQTMREREEFYLARWRDAFS